AGNDISVAAIGAASAGAAATSLTATTAGADTGDIALNGAINVTGLTLVAGSSISPADTIKASTLAATLTGASSALNLGAAANEITTLNAITTPGGFTLNNGNNSLTVAANITATNNAVSIDTGTGTYTQSNNVDVIAGTGAITVVADVVTIGTTNAGNNAFSTSGTLTLKPRTAGQAMSLAGASAFDISALEMARFATGATGPLVIGDTASSGVLTIGAALNMAGKTLVLNGGSITDGAGVKTITAQDVTLNANGQIGTSTSEGIDIAATNLSVNTTGDASAFVRTGAINLGVGTAAGANVGAGTLDLAATGAVTQTAATGNITAGTLNVRTLNNAGAAITLANSGNDAGTVDLQVRNAAGTANAPAAIQYADANAFAISGINTGTGAAGAVTLAAGGTVSQTGVVNASTLAASLSGAGSALNLGTQSNNIVQLNAITSPGGFALNNGNNAVLLNAAVATTDGAVAITTGSAATTFAAGGSIASGGGNVTLTNSNAVKVLGNIDTTGGSGAGDLTVTGAGVVSQLAGSSLKVKGATAIGAGAGNNVTLANAGNDFTGTVAIASGNNVSLADDNALVLGASTISGTLGVAASGAVTQSGAVAVAGLTTLAAGAANNITLGDTGNNFSTVVITSGNNVSIADSNALVLGASTVSGSLGVNTAGAITQSGVLNVTGATTLAAGAANNITLNNASNNFSTVAITSGNNVSITDANALVLGASTVSGTLGVNTAGAVTQSGAVAVAGLTTLAAGAANNITLGDTGNNFSTVVITSGNNVSIADSNALVLGASTVSGSLGVNTAGAITQSGALSGAGAASFAAGSANDITLTSAANDFSSVAVSSGNNVSLRDANALVLGASTVNTSLDVVAAGAVTQSGAIVAPALSVKTLANTGAAITLANAGNNVGTLSLRSRDAADGANAAGALQFTDSNGFDIASLATTVNATLGAGGVVTQSGAIAASGLALTGAGGAYTLGNAGNAVTTLAANTGSIDYRQAGALAVGTVGVAGVTTTGAAKIETTGAASSLTLNNAVASSGTGDAIVLKAASSNAAGVSGGGQLINNVGANGIVASAGRYLVYSGDPAATTEGVAGYSKRYNSDASYVPAGAASTFLYRIAPTLTASADSTSRGYGDSNPVFTGTSSGYIDGDTAASVGVSFVSAATPRTAVAAGPVAITLAATNNENYTLAGTNGALTITRRDLAITATGVDRMYDATTAASVVLSDNRVAGDTLALTSAAATFTDGAIGSDRTINVNGISLGGADAGNYRLANTEAVTRANILRPPTGTFADAKLVRTMAAPMLEAVKAGCGAGVAGGGSDAQAQASSRRDALADGGAGGSSGRGAGGGAC
ncbi:MAG: YDG domain-containing protein, partial [Pseudomonadota bacterium]